MDSKESQCFIILCHLKSHGSITTKEAREICQCERLAADGLPHQDPDQNLYE